MGGTFLRQLVPALHYIMTTPRGLCGVGAVCPPHLGAGIQTAHFKYEAGLLSAAAEELESIQHRCAPRGETNALRCTALACSASSWRGRETIKPSTAVRPHFI
ncbi:unnamed protein product [Pleuronectes platessa]|uniref:Uncharacterized protein n=1 Tax=Pleuronectes platessa TaxID=8262 RepID=A0A9N7YNV3_PLEPL|nr:unnamed protein product [Pleuronectes platessa]